MAGLVAREAGGDLDRKIILPVWHDISVVEISSQSPTLADRVAVTTEFGLSKVVEEINRVTEFVSPTTSELSDRSPNVKSAQPILEHVVKAGPVQPDGGLMPDAVRVVEDLVDRWDENGELNLLVKVQPMSREQRIQLFNEEKKVFLFPSYGMHQVRLEVIDKSYETIGMVWTPPRVSDSDYHKALEFFLREMGFLENDLLEGDVLPVINSADSFWVKIKLPGDS